MRKYKIHDYNNISYYILTKNPIMGAKVFSLSEARKEVKIMQ